jgi:hypothetical protein
MEDLFQQIAHWGCRLTVAAYNQSDWLPPYQPPKTSFRWEKTDFDDAHHLLYRFFDEPRYYCRTCHQYYWGKTACPKQEKHDQEDQDREELKAERAEWINKYQRKNARRIGKERQEEQERMKYEVVATMKQEPDFLPSWSIRWDIILSDELWQAWTPEEKVKWVMDDW